jgi:hypothetical protein
MYVVGIFCGIVNKLNCAHPFACMDTMIMFWIDKFNYNMYLVNWSNIVLVQN